MIQRIQTVYLLGICAILCVLSFGQVLDQWTLNGDVMTHYSLNLRAFYVFDQNANIIQTETQWLTFGATLLLIAYNLFILFSFKNRVKQIKLCKYNFVLILLLVALTFSNAYRVIPAFSPMEAIKGSFFGSILFVFLLYLNFRTLLLIKKDEDLVRSADRIR